MDYIARQAPLSMGFPREVSLSGLPFIAFSGGHPDPRNEPLSPALVGEIFTTEPGKPH